MAVALRGTARRPASAGRVTQTKGDQARPAPVALVTGGGRKLGAAICRRLAGLGYRVVINYRSSGPQAESLLRTIRAGGGSGTTVRADVTRPADVLRMLDRVRGEFGRLDVLVNNVGDYLEKPLHRCSHGEFERILKSNLHSVFLCTQAALPMLRQAGAGRIIVIGFAPAGKISAFPHRAVYHLAKTGALLLTKAIAVEEARYGVTANMISPGTLFNSVKKPSKNPADYIPAGRFCRFEDILGTLEYLLGERASYVTGGHFIVSGGYAV